MRQSVLPFGAVLFVLGFAGNLQGQFLAADWAGGNGTWFGGPSNWVCPSNGGTLCPPPNIATSPPNPNIPTSASINQGAVTTDAPFTLSGLSIGTTGSGTLNINSAGAGSSITFNGATTVGSQGVLNVTGGGTLSSQPGFSSVGTITVSGSGSSLGARDLYLGGGTTNVLNGGILSAIYPTIAGNVTVDGAGSKISSSFGALQINGNVVLSNGGALSSYITTDFSSGSTVTFDISAPAVFGTASGSYFDTEGTIVFDFVNGFAPVAGETFHLITFNNPTGSIGYSTANFEVEGLMPGFQYDFINTNTGLTLEALNNGVTLSPAPEPSSLFVMLAAFTGTIGTLAVRRGLQR